MKQSIDVKLFLKWLEGEHAVIVQELRALVLKSHPRTTERMMYGGIMFSLEEDFGGVFVRKNHVSLEFANGTNLKDPDNLLEGTGESRRHLKIRSLTDIKDKQVEYFIKQLTEN